MFNSIAVQSIDMSKVRTLIYHLPDGSFFELSAVDQLFGLTGQVAHTCVQPEVCPQQLREAFICRFCHSGYRFDDILLSGHWGCVRFQCRCQLCLGLHGYSRRRRRSRGLNRYRAITGHLNHIGRGHIGGDGILNRRVGRGRGRR